MKHKRLFFIVLMLVVAGMAWAQFGPAGVTDNIIAWYAVEDLALESGDPVSIWGDRSGNGNNAVQSTPANQPSLVKSVHNMHPVVRFDGLNDYLSTTLSIPIAQPITLFFFMKMPPNNGSIHNVIDSPGATSRVQFNKQATADSYRMFAGTQNDFTAVGFVDNYVYVSILFNGANSRIWFNGSLVHQGFNPGTNSLGSFFLGARQDLAAGFFLNGEILEFAAFGTALTDTQRQSIESYLDIKYSQTLPVELSSFTAVPNAQHFVELHWTTQSETNVAGFRVYRGESLSLQEAMMFNAFIPATNTATTQYYMFVDREIYADGTYYYWLESVEMSGSSSFYGPVLATVSQGDPAIPGIVPTVSGINKIYPNPFNPSTSIDYMLTNAAPVEITIHNLRGQIVKNLYNGSKNAGFHSVIWDGSSDNGTSVTSGVYNVTVKIGTEIFNRRMVLSK